MSDQKNAILSGIWPIIEAHDPALDEAGIPEGAGVFALIDENYKKYPAPESIPGLTKVLSLGELSKDTYFLLRASSGFSYVVVMSDSAAGLTVKMPEKPNLSPEEIIPFVLNGDTLKNALDFVSFLRANDFQIEYNPDEYDENKWTGAIGGVVGDSIGYMYFCAQDNPPNNWMIWLNEIGINDDGSEVDDEIKEFIWAHVNHCTKCNENWENCGGGERTIFGKKFDRLCHSPMCFETPDVQKLDKLKKFMLKIKQKRDNIQRIK